MKEEQLKQGIGFTDWGNSLGVIRTQKAAYFAMLETEDIVNKNN